MFWSLYYPYKLAIGFDFDITVPCNHQKCFTLTIMLVACPSGSTSDTNITALLCKVPLTSQMAQLMCCRHVVITF